MLLPSRLSLNSHTKQITLFFFSNTRDTKADMWKENIKCLVLARSQLLWENWAWHGSQPSFNNEANPQSEQSFKHATRYQHRRHREKRCGWLTFLAIFFPFYLNSWLTRSPVRGSECSCTADWHACRPVVLSWMMVTPNENQPQGGSCFPCLDLYRKLGINAMWCCNQGLSGANLPVW